MNNSRGADGVSRCGRVRSSAGVAVGWRVHIGTIEGPLLYYLTLIASQFVPKMGVRRSAYIKGLALLGPQSRSGDKLLRIGAVSSPNGTAVLKWSRGEGLWQRKAPRALVFIPSNCLFLVRCYGI